MTALELPVEKGSKEKNEPADGRKERLAAELRANLKRRKTRTQAVRISTAQIRKKPV